MAVAGQESQRSRRRLGILAAAVGSIVSAVAALVTAPTVILGIIGLVGIPVGAFLGWLVGPRLAVETSAKPVVVITSVAAVPLGIGLYALLATVAEGRGASQLDLIGLALINALFVGAYGLLFGWPMALVVASVAAWLFRRLAPRVDRLWAYAAVVVGLVATLTIGTFAVAAFNAGDQAAQQGDRVQLRYRVDNLSDRELSMDIRSYWKGLPSGGSSGYVGKGRCSSSGTDWLLESDWAIWLSPVDTEWVDRPAHDPIITSAEYGRRGSVELTIVIEPDGAAHAIEGIQGGTC